MQLSACPKLERASGPAQSQLSIGSPSAFCVFKWLCETQPHRQKQSSLLSLLILMAVCLSYSSIVGLRYKGQGNLKKKELTGLYSFRGESMTDHSSIAGMVLEQQQRDNNHKSEKQS